MSLLEKWQFDNRHFAQTSPPATHRVAAPLPAPSTLLRGRLWPYLGRREEALAVVREAVESLSPYFPQIPQAFGLWMTAMVLKYLQCCQACSVAPDGESLGPVAAKLEELERERSEQ